MWTTENVGVFIRVRGRLTIILGLILNVFFMLLCGFNVGKRFKAEVESAKIHSRKSFGTKRVVSLGLYGKIVGDKFNKQNSALTGVIVKPAELCSQHWAHTVKKNIKSER